MSETEQPMDQALDIERLARALHEYTLHNRIGGVDDDIAKRVCIQFGWERSSCRATAEALAAGYTVLATNETSPPAK